MVDCGGGAVGVGVGEAGSVVVATGSGSPVRLACIFFNIAPRPTALGGGALPSFPAPRGLNNIINKIIKNH